MRVSCCWSQSRQKCWGMTHTFGVLEVLEEGLLVPGDTLVDVGLGVREAFDTAGLAAEETVKVGANWWVRSQSGTKRERKGYCQQAC